jgi:DNA-binding NarL/FixJ family response regulator
MYPPTALSRLSLRRSSRHGAHHRHRRSRTAAEIATSLEQTWDVQPHAAVVVGLIDPKPLTRQSILKLLGSSLPAHVRLVGASSFDELTAAAETPGSDFGLIILYIRSAGVADTWVQEQLRLIKGGRSEVPVIMISDRDDADDVIRALNQGVRGYIPTSIAAEVAIAALTLIEAGGTYVPADALLPDGPETQSDPECVERQPVERPQVASELNLTSRELAVIDLLREGNANKVIAIKLNMRESTVKVHVRNILKKLRVSNRTHAATVANRLLADAHPVIIADDSAEDGH